MRRDLCLLSAVTLAAAILTVAETPKALAVSARADELAERAYAILKKNCFECHGDAKRGGLDMRTHEALTKGGATGPVVVPHEPEKSRLYRLASHMDEPHMPFR